MMMERGIEKNILKFLHSQFFFYFMKMHKIANLVIEMTFFAQGGISIKNFVMHVHIMNKTLSHKFHPYSIFDT